MTPRPIPSLTDADEIDRAFARFCRSGSPRELAAVYDALAPELLRLALHLTGQASDAEDVLQATFVAAIERAGAFDPARRVLPWMTGILALEARALRRRRGLPDDPERLERRAPPSPGAAAEARELDESLARALARVPEVFRPVLRLHLVHGLSAREIARALERPDGTVRSQLARGTELLRRSLPVGLLGLASACAMREAALASIRARVLAHPALAAAPVWTLPLGVLAMKKLVATAAALLVLVLLWRVARPGAGAEEVRLAQALPATAPVERALASEPARKVRDERESLPELPRPTVTRAPEVAATALVVEASWPAGGPAAGEVVLLTTVDHPRLDQPLTATTGADGRARIELAPGSVFVRLLRGGERSLQLAPGRETNLALELRPGAHVRGRVLDGDGRAVRGASLWLSERYRTNLGHVLATSDAEGRFELRCVGPDHWLGAQKRGFAPGRLVRVQGAREVELELRLLQPGGELRGFVRDERGEPLAGARLLLGAELPPWVRELDGSFVPERPPLWATSAVDGSFAFEGAPLGRAPLTVRARGAAPWSGAVEVLAHGAPELVLTLAREARVVGRVVDPEGEPRSLQVGAGTEGSLAGVMGWSGTDGRFELTGVATGTVELWARDGAEVARAELVLAPGETRSWDARLEHRPRIRGRVLDAHGRPAGGLTVVALWPEQRDMRSRSQPTDAEGRFELGPLEEREHLVMVHPPGGWREFPLAELVGVRPAELELLLTLPDPLELATITAEVVAPGGAALGGAELGLWHEERAAWRGFVTGDDGRLVASGLPSGHVELELRHPRYPWLKIGRRALAQGETLDLGRLEFAPSGTLRVRLAGARGDELRGLTMLLTDEQGRESGVLRLEGDELVSGAIAVGRHSLRVGADGYLQVQRELAVRPGVEELLELRLERCGARTVRILLPAGSPPPAWVAGGLFDASLTQVWRGNADVALTPLALRLWAPPGEHTLHVNAEGGLGGKLTVLVPSVAAELPELELLLARRE